ncbi:thioredoxin [Haloarcula argentinensis]|uniref:Thioredoxin n=1 Tax=Haloarcula argentinensis TaxID=43776 RepID=A0ABU2F555_HALAR|nr:thioredoxin [Haloarcula argentinensis]EMA26457.1 thioredoxin [Haloarcula argentinensis DSM 12282]MDS0255300.1 thioredoxin [Haloarcula argentinensis]
MTDELEEIKREKLNELRSRDESDSTDESESGTLSDPVSIDGKAELSDITTDHDVVLVDFYADWCGPCQMLEPVVETVAAETAATVAKIDVDANQELAAEYGVRGVPTLLLFADGEPVDRLVGMQDEAQLRSVIAEYA